MSIVFLSLISLLIYYLYYLFTPHILYPLNYREPYLPVPKKYIVNNSYILPVWNQFDRGTCWAFAVTYLLESQYKHQGIQFGYLKDNQYVAFSQEGLTKFMVDKCLQDPLPKTCLTSARRHNKSSSGSVEDFINFYHEFSDLKKSILPYTACPYYEEEIKERHCPNFNNYIDQNPIEFEFLNGELAVGNSKVKELLFKVKTPISFSIPLPVTRYWFKCNENKIINNTEMCIEKLYPCKNEINTYCSFLDYQLSKPNTAEMITHNSKSISYGVGHAMVLIGYNDNFIEPLPINLTQKPPSKGIFILRNSWGSRGHSLEYLMGQISHEQELMICPNFDDVMNWIPITYECFLQTNDGKKCSLDIKRQIGKNLLIGGTELICKNNTHCKEGDSYYLLRNQFYEIPNIQFSSQDVPLATLINSNSKEIEIFNSIPFEHLYYAVKPKIQINNSIHCGYIGLTYDSLDHLNEILGPNTPIWRAISYQFKFKKQSYQNSGYWKNYELINSSTYEFSTIKINDPLTEL